MFIPLKFDQESLSIQINKQTNNQAHKQICGLYRAVKVLKFLMHYFVESATWLEINGHDVNKSEIFKWRSFFQISISYSNMKRKKKKCCYVRNNQRLHFNDL